LYVLVLAGDGASAYLGALVCDEVGVPGALLPVVHRVLDVKKVVTTETQLSLALPCPVCHGSHIHRVTTLLAAYLVVHWWDKDKD